MIFSPPDCGPFHVAAKVKPALPDVPRPALTGGREAHMLEHQWAVDVMYQGLIGPSDELWKKGVDIAEEIRLIKALADEGYRNGADRSKQAIPSRTDRGETA